MLTPDKLKLREQGEFPGFATAKMILVLDFTATMKQSSKFFHCRLIATLSKNNKRKEVYV